MRAVPRGRRDSAGRRQPDDAIVGWVGNDEVVILIDSQVPYLAPIEYRGFECGADDSRNGDLADSAVSVILYVDVPVAVNCHPTG